MPTPSDEHMELLHCLSNVVQFGQYWADVVPKSFDIDFNHTGLWLRTGCVTNAQVSVFERTGF